MIPVLGKGTTDPLTEEEFYALGTGAGRWRRAWRRLSGLVARRPAAKPCRAPAE
ncbi:hypothetical protein [Mesobacterium pallidum]|uniref:hypothetical protein n=1 Tax=Mesobacterium pallidum TaxID=2872037 RepID=UPI001EE318F3|nr:hypothetical protein [Mesobacterium pallidum]